MSGITVTQIDEETWVITSPSGHTSVAVDADSYLDVLRQAYDAIRSGDQTSPWNYGADRLSAPPADEPSADEGSKEPMDW